MIGAARQISSPCSDAGGGGPDLRPASMTVSASASMLRLRYKHFIHIIGNNTAMATVKLMPPEKPEAFET
jgi:hypothetical protein